LYVTALIELLGPAYINYAIKLHKNHIFYFKDLQQNISKFLEWQTHTASSYTTTMRKAYKIINHKYNTSNIDDTLVENNVLNPHSSAFVLTADKVPIVTDTRVNFLGRMYCLFFRRRSNVKWGLYYNVKYRNRFIERVREKSAIHPDS